MSDNFWDQDKVSELDMLSEEIEEQTQKIIDEYEAPEEEEYEEEEYEEEETMSDYEPTKAKAAYKLNKHENSVVSDAMVRLEQARLYDMLIKHDLFKGVKAHPSALRNVQNELKSYIVQRLEILLGLKKEKVEKELPKQVQVELPFNDVEIEFLKALSYKGTKGASAQLDSKKVVATEVLPTVAAPKQIEQQEPEGLQPLGGYDEDDYEDDYEEEVIEEPARPKKVVKKKPAPKTTPKRKPVKKTPQVKKTKPSRAKINRRGEISDEEAERIAREDIERMKGYKKPAHKMSAQELIEANKRINSNKSGQVQGAKPIPTGSSLEMHYRTKQANQSANPQSGGFNVLLNQLLANKK